jgi:integrase
MSAPASPAPARPRAKRGALIGAALTDEVFDSSPSLLRHTFGTRMAAAGAPLRNIQEWMGHRDYKTTEIYADYAPDPVQGARWAEAAFPGDDGEDENATDDETKPAGRLGPGAA